MASAPPSPLAAGFQSAPPVWGATFAILQQTSRLACFNPRPPCGGRHPQDNLLVIPLSVSIRAPRVGGDSALRGEELAIRDVSIRAPRVGSDSNKLVSFV